MLLGDADEPDWVADEATYADKAISLRLGTMATRIDRDRKVVVASRHEYPYDKLLIATGSAPRRLDVHGSELDGLLTLRTLEESLALRERFTEGANDRDRGSRLDRLRGRGRRAAARGRSDHDRAAVTALAPCRR